LPRAGGCTPWGREARLGETSWNGTSLAAALAAQTAECNPEEEINVNSRYTVESIELSPAGQEARLSESLRGEIRKRIGERFDQPLLDTLRRKIRRELGARSAELKVQKGSKPEHVKVVIQISEKKDESEFLVARLVYHSKQNWSFGADATWRREGQNLRFGILTDNDELIERYSGLRGGFERRRIAGDHLRLRFDVETWRAQWNPATRVALEQSPDVPGIYRTRFHFQPAATVVFTEALTLSLGVSFQRLDTQFPAAYTEAATAAVSTLRYRQRWRRLPDHRHEVDAGYNLRTAARSLESDFVYTRHFWDALYRYRSGRERLAVSLMAGLLNGRAPLFERFVLGNSRTLRGWNKFDVDPLGGDRMVHGSIDHSYSDFRVVYDVGSTWRRGQPAKVRQSIGVGYGSKDGFTMLVAFPVKEGRLEPIFLMGVNF